MKMEVVFDYDDKTGTWSEAPEVYGTIECATKEDYEYAKKAIKGYKELEAKHWDECRQIAHYDDEIKRLQATDVQPVKHGRWFHINNDSFIYCSECNNEAYWDTDYGQQLFDYCPYCGAKMIKDGDTNG
jgi:hypothetical protein